MYIIGKQDNPRFLCLLKIKELKTVTRRKTRYIEKRLAKLISTNVIGYFR